MHRNTELVRVLVALLAVARHVTSPGGWGWVWGVSSCVSEEL